MSEAIIYSKLVGPVIQKEDTAFRKSISAEQRLVKKRVGKSIVCNIIS